MKTWEDMEKVQPLASKVIMNSIAKDRISHAYLIQGEEGTGKEALARLLTKSLFCENKQGVEPCHVCNICKRITSGNHPDVHWVRPDGRSIKIEQIRDLQQEFIYSGLESHQKVYIITGADTLTLNAANRILKFLEEPSKKTTAIMLTSNSQAIIPTIRSRCQVVDLQPLHPTSLQEKLIDAGLTEKNALLYSTLTNNYSDALALNSDEWFAEARKIVLQLINACANNPEEVYLMIHQYWLPHFKEREQQERGLDLLLIGFKDMIYYHIQNRDALIMYSPQEQEFERIVIQFSLEKLITILQSILQSKRKLKQNVHPTLVMEQLTLHIQR